MWRDLTIVVKSVWVNLALFAAMLLAGALLLHLSGAYPGVSFFELTVDTFHMAHLERVAEPGDGFMPFLLTFITPLLTLAILGEGVLRILSTYLQRGENREEWDLMVAKTFKDHILICGVGELGRAVFKRLIARIPDALMVLVDTRTNILAELAYSESNVVHIQANMTSRDALIGANCKDASLIIMASGNDAHNLEAAFKAFELNPQAEIWVRLYRTQLASLMDLQTKPNIHFFSPYESAADGLVASLNTTS
jgi:voltage-gated potassium channel Kch